MKHIFYFFAVSFIQLIFATSIFAACPSGFDNATVTANSNCSLAAGTHYIIDNATTEGSTTNSADLVVATGGSLTIPNTASISAGRLLLTGGSITIQNGATINLGPKWVLDSDADGYASNLTAFYTSTASGRRRLSLMKSKTTRDCNDSVTGHNNTLPSATYYIDSDNDTYTSGSASAGTSLCSSSSTWTASSAISSPGSASVTSFTAGTRRTAASGTSDCNDANASAYLTVNGYVDSDADGYGSGSLVTCGATGTTYVANNTDCGPNTATAYPGSTTCSSTSFLNASSVTSYDYDCSASGGTGTACGTTYYSGTTTVFAEWQDIVGACVPNSGPTCNSVGSAASCGSAGYTQSSTTRCGDGTCGNLYTIRGSSGTQSCK